MRGTKERRYAAYIPHIPHMSEKKKHEHDDHDVRFQAFLRTGIIWRLKSLASGAVAVVEGTVVRVNEGACVREKEKTKRCCWLHL